MKNEQPHIIAECAKCHFRFDILFKEYEAIIDLFVKIGR